MDCNREEAVRACRVAEKKFRDRDISGAKKLVLKAQNLYPELDGLAQMAATFDVHLASEALVNGEKNWYAILGISASADDETVKKQYRKLALALHPDKNKSIGAEEAFKLVSEAWSLLCDKRRRMEYDQKRTAGVSLQPSHASSNGFYHHGFRKSTAVASSSAVPTNHPQGSTFWTSCHNCKMQYEYLRIYVNNSLLCPNCHKPFLAVETHNPTNGHDPPVPWSSTQHQHTVNNSRTASRQKKNTNYASQKGSTTSPCRFKLDPNGRNFQSVAFNRPPGSAAASHSQSANVFPSVHVNIKKDDDLKQDTRRTTGFGGSSLPEAGSNFYSADKLDKSRQRISEDKTCNDHGASLDGKDRVVQGSLAFTSNTQNTNGTCGDSGKFRTYRYGSLKREVSHLDVRAMLVRRGQLLVKEKLEHLAHENTSGSIEKGSIKQKGKRKERVRDKENGTNLIIKDGSDVVKKEKLDAFSEKASSEKSITLSNDLEQPVHMDVPDPDFHDFDEDRSERCFEPDQVWATYDDEDGMPRLYALVQKVISLKPFKIRMSFLTSKSNIELGPLNWVGMGFSKTCGEFRVSRYAVKDSINIFSHKVQWEKGSRGVIKILPKKGDTWALYRNWSADWNEYTSDDTIYKYDMVEVLDDYNEEQGVNVTPLVKVAGFKTVFHRHIDSNEIIRIPREEMFRFSHQVPSYCLTGMESKDIPRGCRELDPAATPIELLQVITEGKDDSTKISQAK